MHGGGAVPHDSIGGGEGPGWSRDTVPLKILIQGKVEAELFLMTAEEAEKSRLVS